MAQASAKLRSFEGGFSHWCPGCGEMHQINVSADRRPQWLFDGNLVLPTFSPSIKFWGKQTVKDADGEWTGEWVRGPDGEPLDFCCHYFISGGMIQFCSDSTHALAGRDVPLPDLPTYHQDKVTEELRDRLERQTP